MTIEEKKEIYQQAIAIVQTFTQEVEIWRLESWIYFKWRAWEELGTSSNYTRKGLEMRDHWQSTCK